MAFYCINKYTAPDTVMRMLRGGGHNLAQQDKINVKVISFPFTLSECLFSRRNVYVYRLVNLIEKAQIKAQTERVR